MCFAPGFDEGEDELGDFAGGAEGRVALEAFERELVGGLHAAGDLFASLVAGVGDAHPELDADFNLGGIAAGGRGGVGDDLPGLP